MDKFCPRCGARLEWQDIYVVFTLDYFSGKLK